MSDLEKRERFNAYYYGFDATGVEAIDSILRLVAAAGKGYHSTEFWSDPMWDEGPSYVERIQQAANDAARRFASLTSPETVEKAARVIYEFDDAVPKPPYWSDCTEDMVAWYKSAAEAVLRSVEEDET